MCRVSFVSMHPTAACNLGILKGEIPSTLGGLTDLTELNLGSNKLSGEAPPLMLAFALMLTLLNYYGLWG